MIGAVSTRALHKWAVSWLILDELREIASPMQEYITKKNRCEELFEALHEDDKWFATNMCHEARRRMADGPPPIRFGYTNWRGEFAERIVLPLQVKYTAVEHHPEPQWLLFAYDYAKNAERAFALAKMVESK